MLAIRRLWTRRKAPSNRGLALERSLIAGLFGTRDRHIGMQSFIENGGRVRRSSP